MQINRHKKIKASKIWFCLFTPLLLTLSFPKFGLFFLGWIALVPLLLAVQRIGWCKSFILSWIVGLLSFMGIFTWINRVEGFSFIHYLLLGLYLGIYFGIFGSMIHIFDPKQILYPVYVALIWVCLEYLRSHFFFLAFPWALLGHTQYKNINFIQCASFTGVYGLSFLMALVNASLSVFLYRIYAVFKNSGKKKNRFYEPSLFLYLSPIFLVLLLCLWGRSIRQKEDYAKKIRVGVVQGNFSQEIKWKKEVFSYTIDKYLDLTKKAANEQPLLIIWPETSIPLDFRSYPTKMWKILRLARDIKIPLVCGAAGSAKIRSSQNTSRGIYNSAFYISGEGTVAGEYRKMKLLPFGEYLPSLGRLSFSAFFRELKNRFLSGGKARVFSLYKDKDNFGITICWENIFPDLFRRFVLNGASFMVNISNDGWFKNSAGPYQHLMCNVFRAVENRISIARAANTGISCFISPFGEIIGKITNEGGKDLNVTGVATGELPFYRGPTFYTKYGDIFSFVCITFLILSLSRYMIRLFIFK